MTGLGSYKSEFSANQ